MNSRMIISRFVISLIDLLILVGSFTMAYFSLRQFDYSLYLLGHFLTYVSLYSAICLIVSYKMNVYNGLIRHSNLQDMLRIFVVQLLASFIFFFIVETYWELFFSAYSYNVTGVLIINYFVSSSLLIMFRVTAKEIFDFASRSLGTKKRVLICGTGQEAILLKHALEANSENSYTVVGFISMDMATSIHFLEQKPIFRLEQLIASPVKIDQLLVTKEQLKNQLLKIFINNCLEQDIRILTIPASAQWISGESGLKQIKQLKIEDLLQRPPIVIENDKVLADLKSKTILVTGAAGSIGSEIVRQIVGYNPALVILLDQAESPLYDMQLEMEEKFPDTKVKIVLADIRNYEMMETVFLCYQPSILFHAAAYKHVPMMEENPAAAIRTNVLGTKNLVDLAINYRLKTFVMISSDKAVNPSNVMGASKRIAEIYIQSLINKETPLSTKFIITRFGNVLGSNGSVIPRFRAQIEAGGPLTVTHKEITRFFMTIPEAVNLVLEAAVMGKGGETFVFDMGESVKINNLAIRMIELAGLVPYRDIQIKYTGLRPGEKLYEELLGNEESLLPTYHDRIRISTGVGFECIPTSIKIDRLIRSACHGHVNEAAIVKQMKLIAEDFISQNSRFQLLDNTSQAL